MRKSIEVGLFVFAIAIVSGCYQNRAALAGAQGSFQKSQKAPVVPMFQRFASTNPRKDAPAGSVLLDIIQHLPKSYGNTYYSSDKVTWAHETCHGIASHLRNSIKGKQVNAFYLTGDRYVVVNEFPFKKSRVGGYLPKTLQSSRSNFYIYDNKQWDNQPTFLLDEWTAYTNGAHAAIDLVERGAWKGGRRDALMGMVHFTPIAIAVAMTAYEEADEYWDAHGEDFTAFLGWHLERVADLLRDAKSLNDLHVSDPYGYWNKFLDHPDSKPMHDFLSAVLGRSFLDKLQIE